MRALLVILFALLIALLAGNFLVNANGYVQIHAAGWVIQASVAFFALSLFVIFIIGYVLLRSFFLVTGLPHRLKVIKKHKYHALSEKFLQQGLMALVEGRWKQAEKVLIKGARYASNPGINYLFAARAAQRQGKLEYRDHYLALAHDQGMEDNLATEITRAELQLQQQQTEQALATLNLLQENYYSNNQIKLMLLNTRLKLQDWDEAEILIDEIERTRMLDREQVKTFKKEIWNGKIHVAGKSGDKISLNRTWHNLPRNLKKDSQLLENYVIEKIRVSDTDGCEHLLRKAIKSHWDSRLVYLYGLVKGNEISRQLAFAESLQQQHARDPVLLLTLGRLAIINSLWGKAQSYLKESLEIKPMPETYRELAIICEHQGNFTDANRYYEQGLALATSQEKHESTHLLEQIRETEAASAGARQVF